MPAAVVAAFAVAGVTITQATASTILFVATVALNVGLGILMAPKNKTKPQRSMNNIRMERAPRKFAVGRCILRDGVTVYEEATVGQNSVLYNVVAHCQGPVDAIELVYLDDAEVRTARLKRLYAGGQGYTDYIDYPSRFKYNGSAALQVELHKGEADQVVSPLLAAAFPNSWTANHRLRGICYSTGYNPSLKAQNFNALYRGSRAPDTGVCLRGMGGFDPRLDLDPDDWRSWPWSRNAGCIMLAFLLRPELDGGMGLSLADIEPESWKRFCDLADETLALANGFTEPRWTLDGSWTSADDPGEVLGEMQRACVSEIYLNAMGRVAIRAGRWEPPRYTYGPNHIIDVEMERGPDAFNAVNHMRVAWNSLDLKGRGEGRPVEDLDLQALAGGRVRYGSFENDFAGSHHQARRVALIQMRAINAGWKGKISASLMALEAWDDANVRLTIPDLGIYEKPFRVLSRVLDERAEKIIMDVQETGEDHWLDAPYAAPPPLPPSSDSHPPAPRLIHPFVCVAGTGPDGTGSAFLEFWATPPLRRDMFMLVEYWADGAATVTQTEINGSKKATLSGTWTRAIFPASDMPKRINGLTAGTTYKFWSKYITPEETETEWTSAWNETDNLTTPHSRAASLTASTHNDGNLSALTDGTSTGVELSLTATTSPWQGRVRIYYTGTSSVYAATTLVADVFLDPKELISVGWSDPDLANLTAHWFWADFERADGTLIYRASFNYDLTP